MVQAPAGDARGVDDIVHGGAVIAVLLKEIGGDIEDAGAQGIGIVGAFARWFGFGFWARYRHFCTFIPVGAPRELDWEPDWELDWRPGWGPVGLLSPI